MIHTTQTFECDGCGAREVRATSESLPKDWCFLGYLVEEHDSGHAILCPLCVAATGFAEKLRALNQNHRDERNRTPIDDERPAEEARPS